MKFAISAVFLLSLFATAAPAAEEGLRERLLRERAIDAGLVPVEELLRPFSPARSAAGRLLFKSKELSISRETACDTCHLDRFSSADGIPNAIGTKGIGEGIDRVRAGGDVVPRNTLPLWGRGSKGFDVFFWDGKVDASSGSILSQFAGQEPSDDPLVVAAHLPIVELRELVPDSPEIDGLRAETVDAAETVYALIEERVKADPELSAAVATAFDIDKEDIRILHVAESIAEFVRDRFRLRETPFHRFVFGDGALTETELAGGLLFYGKARCASCHGGPFLSDLSFHAIPFGQLGFGKNGFGVDYGRFNVTMDPSDLYKFRTPPLFNVEKTAPYSHSGSVFDLRAAIRAHVDPLAMLDLTELSEVSRVEFYKRLEVWSQEQIHEVPLSDNEIDALAAFLLTLSFDDPEFQS